MSFMRLFCVFLGVAGIGIAAFVAITEEMPLVFLLLGPLFGAPLFMAWAGWPKKWFALAEQSDIRQAGGPDRYRRYTRMDYVLMAAIALSAVPLFWLRSYLPTSFASDSDPGRVFVFVFIVLTASARHWQTKIPNTTDAIASFIAIVIGAAITYGGWNGRGSGLLPWGVVFGYMILYAGIWSLIRAGLLFTFEKKNREKGTPRFTHGGK